MIPLCEMFTVTEPFLSWKQQQHQQQTQICHLFCDWSIRADGKTGLLSLKIDFEHTDDTEFRVHGFNKSRHQNWSNQDWYDVDERLWAWYTAGAQSELFKIISSPIEILPYRKYTEPNLVLRMVHIIELKWHFGWSITVCGRFNYSTSHNNEFSICIGLKELMVISCVFHFYFPTVPRRFSIRTTVVPYFRPLLDHISTHFHYNHFSTMFTHLPGIVNHQLENERKNSDGTN